MMTSDSQDVNQRPHRVILGFLRHEQWEFTIKYFFDLLAKKPIVLFNKDVFLKLVGRARKKLKKNWLGIADMRIGMRLGIIEMRNVCLQGFRDCPILFQNMNGIS